MIIWLAYLASFPIVFALFAAAEIRRNPHRYP